MKVSGAPFDEDNMVDDELFKEVNTLALIDMAGIVSGHENSEEFLLTEANGDIVWAFLFL